MIAGMIQDRIVFDQSARRRAFDHDVMRRQAFPQVADRRER